MCNCGGKARQRSVGRPAPAQAQAPAATRYEVLVNGKVVANVDTILAARRLRAQQGGVIRTASA